MSVEFDFINAGLPGLAGASSLTSPQQLIDLIQKAQPGRLMGLVIYSDTAPDNANNPRFYRYLWFDTVNLLLKYYNVNTYTWTAMPAGAVSSVGQITNGLITPAKLAPGVALTLMRTNGAGTAIELVPLTAILTANTVPLSALVANTAPDGSVLRSIGGITQWDALDNLANQIVALINNYDITKLTDRIPSALLATDATSKAMWIASASFVSTILTDLSIPLSKLAASGATTNQVIAWNGSNWDIFSLPFTKFLTVTVAADLPAAGANATVTFTHNLGVIPKFVQIVAVCVAAPTAPAAVGDEIGIEAFGNGTNTFGYIQRKVNTIDLLMYTSFASYYSIFYPSAPTSAYTFQPNKWNLKAYIGV